MDSALIAQTFLSETSTTIKADTNFDSWRHFFFGSFSTTYASPPMHTECTLVGIIKLVCGSCTNLAHGRHHYSTLETTVPCNRFLCIPQRSPTIKQMMTVLALQAQLSLVPKDMKALLQYFSYNSTTNATTDNHGLHVKTCYASTCYCA